MNDVMCRKLGLPSKHGEIYKLSQLFMIWRDRDAYLQTKNIKYLDINLDSGMFVLKWEQAHSQCAMEKLKDSPGCLLCSCFTPTNGTAWTSTKQVTQAQAITIFWNIILQLSELIKKSKQNLTNCKRKYRTRSGLNSKYLFKIFFFDIV